MHYPDYTGGRLNTRPEQACVGLFAGSLNYKLLTNSQKTVVLEEGLPEGDYRRWQDIRAWTDDIAVRLKGNARRQMLL